MGTVSGSVRRAWSAGVMLLGGLAAATLAQPAAPQADEADPVLTAAAVLASDQLRGPHHTFDEAVRTPGSYHVLTLQSTFGPFEVHGTSQVAVRLQEIQALAALEDLNRAGVFARAAGESLVKVGTGVVNAVSDPVDTAKGIGGGVKRLAVNLGRRAKRAAGRVTQDGGKGGDGGGAGAAAAGAARGLLGVNGARRRWARRIGVDPYTTNPVLHEALERVAEVDVAGGIVTSVVIPIPPVVGTTASVGDLVWGRDPEELRKLNEARVRELGVASDDAGAFFRNRRFTLTMQTRLIQALRTVNVSGAGDYLVSASEAEDEREALFFVESAEMLQAFHETSPVAAVLPDSRAMVAKRPSGEVTALLPLDWVRDSAAVRDQVTDLAARSRRELGATTLRVTVSGTVTDKAAVALARVGWQR